MAAIEVVDTVQKCRTAVQLLEREEVIAADAEGVHLSKTGPLTLLQVGTTRGNVYLFDVKREPRMFSGGGLKRLLESDRVVKVMHSGKNDGEALYWQFRVELRGVFDTQVAQHLLDKASGRRHPARQKLSEVVNIHCPQKSASVEEGKDAVQTKWTKSEGEYWAKRPLTSEMIHYASNDVLVLIPEVYNSQKRLLLAHGLMDKFTKTVEEDIRSKRDKALWEKLIQAEKEEIKSILKDFASSAPRTTKLADITDEDVLGALSQLRLDELPGMGLPPLIRDLKVQSMKTKLQEIEEKLDSKGEDFEPNNNICGFVRACAVACDDQSVKDYGTRLQERIDAIVIEDAKRKYTVNTPVEHLANYELMVLGRKIRPRSENDPNIDPVCLELHWNILRNDLDQTYQKYKEDPMSFEVREGFVKKLRICSESRSVPADIQEKGSEFLSALQEAGRIPRPTSSA